MGTCSVFVIGVFLCIGSLKSNFINITKIKSVSKGGCFLKAFNCEHLKSICCTCRRCGPRREWRAFLCCCRLSTAL